MKKLLLFTGAVVLSSTLFSQALDLPFYEDFESSMLIPSAFTLINVDGNTPASAPASLADSAFIVRYSDDMESHVAYGVSYYTPDAGADDWLILPKLALTNNPKLSWKALSLTSSGDYPDTYEVLISTTDTETGSFVNLFRTVEEVAVASGGPGVQKRSLDLTPFAGQEVYIAFRLMTPSPGGDRLGIDDIRVEETLEVGFESGFPSSWGVFDGGDNPGSWFQDDYAPFKGDYNATVQTYQSDPETTSVDDWLYTSKITVFDGYELSFYANTSSSNYPDALQVLLSTTDMNLGDFTITVANINPLNTDWTKYSYVLSDIDGVNAGDEIHIAFYTNVIGDYLGLDEVRYGPVTEPKMIRAFAISETAVDVYFDAELERTYSPGEFTLSGSGDITFSSATVDETNPTIVHLTGGTPNMAGDNVLDMLSLQGQDGSYEFYAGITPLSYTSITNPDGVLEFDGPYATFHAIIMGVSDDTSRVWVADEAGAHHGVNTYDMVLEEIAVGDEILFYGKLSPYGNQTEIYPATLMSIVSSGNTLYQSTIIPGSDISNTSSADEDPAEKYEGVLVTVENAEVTAWDGAYFTLTDDGGTSSFWVSDWYVYTDGFGENTLTIGNTYNITGLLVGRDGEYRMVPRNANDIVDITSVQVRDMTALHIYPVPVADQLYIENVADYSSVMITTITGQVCFNEEVDARNNIVVDMSEYKNGVYVVQLTRPGAGMTIKKVIKQ